MEDKYIMKTKSYNEFVKESEKMNESMPMDRTRERLLNFLMKEVRRSGQQINTTDIILDFLTNEYHEKDEYERIIDILSSRV